MRELRQSWENHQNWCFNSKTTPVTDWKDTSMVWQPALPLSVPLLPKESRVSRLETKMHAPRMPRQEYPAALCSSHPLCFPAVQPCSIHWWQAMKSPPLPSKTPRRTSIKRKVRYLPTKLLASPPAGPRLCPLYGNNLQIPRPRECCST